MFCLAFVFSGKRLVLPLIGGPVLFRVLASRRPSLVIFRKLQPFTKQNVCVQLQWAKNSLAGRGKKAPALEFCKRRYCSSKLPCKMECRGKGAKKSFQSRPFLPPFHRYIDTC